MLKFMPRNNSARGEIRLFNFTSTVNNNENTLFSLVDKAVHGKKEEPLKEVVYVEKKNVGLIMAIIGATCIAVTAVTWLLFTALKLAGGRLPWEAMEDGCCCELPCCEEDLEEEEV